MATDYAEMVKNLQSESIKTQREKAKIEADIFASIREAHNSLARAGSYIKGEHKDMSLLVLPESTSSVVYSIGQVAYEAIDDLLVMAYSPENHDGKSIIFKSESRTLRKLLSGERNFFVKAEEGAAEKALAFYLQLMAEIVTFKTRK